MSDMEYFKLFKFVSGFEFPRIFLLFVYNPLASYDSRVAMTLSGHKCCPLFSLEVLLSYSVESDARNNLCICF